MSQTILPTDLYVSGSLSAKSFTAPAGSITDAAVAGGAGVQASKLQHQHEPAYRQESATAAASEGRVLHAVEGATATVVGFAAGAVVPLTGNDACAVDLLKNGVSVLTAPIALAAADAAYALKGPAGYASLSLVAGDVLEVRVAATHNTGTLPKGVFARLVLREDAQ